ncbi:siderophore-interacting protein [Propionicicella superfundia]|uniref:siderophore-interacting protein n=1 Tax=Propionicicella superfundia TaxID=348582 RepID=UPI001B7FEA7F|nr:siderophore-interacting protein [Propionicicella superfundia]
MPRLSAPRPAYRPYAVRVAATRRLGRHFVRVSLTGADLAHFGGAGLDQRVKLILPLPDGTLADVGQADAAVIDAGTWYERWRALPSGRRPPMRTYTVRRIDPHARLLDIDIVVHGDTGPGSTWAANASPGHDVVVVGPDERSPDSRIGLDWRPGTARRVLLAGDETAAPAICAIVESLAPGIAADAFIEVPDEADAQPLRTTGDVRVNWLGRGDAPHGAPLRHAVTDWATHAGDVLGAAATTRHQPLTDIDVDRDLLWDSPGDADGEFYAWIAGESATVKALRALLVGGHGVDRAKVAFMGYWRLGRAERTG